MREHLEKGVLHGFVGVCRVAQEVIGDAGSAALLPNDEGLEPVAGTRQVAALDERLDLGGDARVLVRLGQGRQGHVRRLQLHGSADGFRFRLGHATFGPVVGRFGH